MKNTARFVDVLTAVDAKCGITGSKFPRKTNTANAVNSRQHVNNTCVMGFCQ